VIPSVCCFRLGAVLLPLLAIMAPASAQGDALERSFQAAWGRQDCPAIVQLAETRLAAREPLGSRAIDLPLMETGLFCVASSDDVDRTGRFALATTGMDNASDGAWRARLWVEAEHGESNAGVATVGFLSRMRPAVLNAAPTYWLTDLDDRLKEAGLIDDRLAFLTALTGGRYAPADLFVNADTFRLRQARLLVARGDAEGARRLVAALRTPLLLIDASADPALRALLPDGFDLRAAVEADLARALEDGRARPRHIAPLYEAAQDLRWLGRFAESLATLRRAEQMQGGIASAADAEDNLNWWRNAMAETYHYLDRYDDMVAAYRLAIAAGERGVANVSQTINLAGAQTDMGRYQDALDTLASLDVNLLSPYGQFAARRIHGCAAFALGQTATSQADLAYLLDHRADMALNATMIARLFLCQGDLDAAAAEYIRLLDDPDTRADALTSLADTDPPPPHLQATREWQAQRQLIARPDVQAALARAGGVPRIPLIL